MPTKTQLQEAEGIAKDFDWAKVDGLTDDQIIAAAKADPDSSLHSDVELAEFDLVIPAKSRRKPPAAAE